MDPRTAMGVGGLFEGDPAGAFVGRGHEKHRATAGRADFRIKAADVFLERGDAVFGEFREVVLQDDTIVMPLLDAFVYRGQPVENAQRSASLRGTIGHKDSGRVRRCRQQADMVFEAAVVIGEAVADEEESHGRRRVGWGNEISVSMAAGQEPHQDPHPSRP